MEQKNESSIAELMRRLGAFWDKVYSRCDEFYDEYDSGSAEIDNEPFECNLSMARVRAEDGGGIAIDYSAAHVYSMCANFCEDDADEEQCNERCLEEAEANAKSVFAVYRSLVDKWAKKRGVSYTEELRRNDGLNFTLVFRI
jgi:hypothetical protein